MKLTYWDSQFQFREVLPDFEDCLARMQIRSDAVRDRLSLETLTYGEDSRQWCEVAGQMPAGGILPVFIHGGYWRALEAERHRFVLPALQGINGAVGNLEYRLLPHVSLSDIIDDACAGLKALSAHSSCRVLAIGHSAGGHLATMAARFLPDIVAGAVSVSGLYDLRPLQWSFLREEIGLRFEDIDGHSPQDLWAGCDARNVVTAVGENETNEFQRQAHVFASSHSAHFLSVPNAHHMTVLDDLERSNGALIPTISNMLKELEA